MLSAKKIVFGLCFILVLFFVVSFVKGEDSLPASVQESFSSSTETVQNNVTSFIDGLEVGVSTTQYGAILGKPVKWKKTISLSDPGNVTIDLPSSAQDVQVSYVFNEDNVTVEEGSFNETVNETNSTLEESSSLNDSVNDSLNESFGDNVSTEIVIDSNGTIISGDAVYSISRGRESNWLTRFFSFILRITALSILQDEPNPAVTLNDSVAQADVEYTTEAPYSVEKNTLDGKEVTIVGPTDVHYERVLAYTSVDVPLRNLDNVRIYWKENDSYLGVEGGEDVDGDGLYDYVSWIVPHLSNQTFVIVITGAEHLDENRTFVSDIYDSVSTLDGNWSEEIPAGDYVRVTFEKNLTSENDITLYPRTISGTPLIEVYEKNSFDKIAQFDSLSDNAYNKVLLTNLSGSQDVFDLLVLNGSVEFDHIIDPTYPNESISNFTTSPVSNITQRDGYYYLAVDRSNSPYDGLVAYWSFDRDSSNTSYDLAGNYSGTYLGDALSVGSCPYDNCSSFDGTNDAADDSINISGLFNSTMFNSSFSVSLWVKLGSLGVQRDIIGTETSPASGTSGWNMRVRSNDAIAFALSNGSVSCTSTFGLSSLNANQWYHLVAVYNATYNSSTGSCTLYQNLASSTNADGPPNGAYAADEFNIGATSSAARIWNGSIDEVMIFNKTLTSTEVTNIFRNQSRRFFMAGTFENRQVNITSGNDMVNLSLNDFEKNQGSNISISLAQWENSLGYNDTDTILPSSLIGFFHLGNSFNSSSFDNNGTAIGNVSFVPGIYGNASSFDGTDDAINITSVNMTNVTISAWIFPRNTTDNVYPMILNMPRMEIFVSLNTSGSDRYSSIGLNSRRTTTNSSFRTTAGSLILNRWTHVVVVYSNNSVGLSAPTIYLDGTSQSVSNVGGIGSGNYTDNAGRAYIGDNAFLASSFNGSIDDLMIYNRSLNATEVRDLYVRGRALWNYSNVFTNVTSLNRNVSFSISNTTTNILPVFQLMGGSNGSYTPLILGNLSLDFGTADYPPYFTGIPNNTTITYKEGFNVTFNATDSIGFGTFAINWSSMFSINSSGYLQNSTQLPAGTYLITVTINDSSGSTNSTLYRVNVSKANSSIYTYLDSSRANASINEGDSIDLNASLQVGEGIIGLFVETDMINNGTSPLYNLTSFSTSGTYNVTSIYPTTQNYTESSETWYVEVADMGGGGGGGGGGNGGGGSSSGGSGSGSWDITISPSSFSVIVRPFVSADGFFIVENNLKKILSFTIITEGLDSFLTLPSQITVNPGEQLSVPLSINATEKGTFTGKIILIGDNNRFEVPVIIRSEEEAFLFDVGLALDEGTSIVSFGKDLVAHLRLNQVGPKEKVDVTATYVITDKSGKVYSKVSETFFVDGNKEYVKNLPTSELPAGNYVLSVTIFYPGAFATSTAEFQVKSGLKNGYILYGVFVLIILTGIIVAGVKLFNSRKN